MGNQPIRILKIIIFFFIFTSTNTFPQKEHVEIGIDEKLGNYLPLNANFKNSDDDIVTLDEVINKPVLLAFVYYECPGICNNTLTELAWVIDRVDMVPGEDFEVICISIDHEESPEIAKRTKHDYLTSIQRDFPSGAWHFLTSDSATVNIVTQAAGFQFKKYGEEYRHPGGLITISPEGKISRYIFGAQFNQFDVKMALIDAQAGKTNPTVAKMLQFCFTYDPEGREYRLNITRIIGTIMLIGVLILLSLLIFKKRNTKLKNT